MLVIVDKIIGQQFIIQHPICHVICNSNRTHDVTCSILHVIQHPPYSQMQQKVVRFKPFSIPQTLHLSPQNPDFYKFDLNLAILTKYGRYIYIRYGNEQRCSSFFATLATIVNKLELSFGKMSQEEKEPGSAQLKCIKLGKLSLWVVRKLNFMYICWAKIKKINEIVVYSMVEYMQHQLMSCLTLKVNAILDDNQTYDPAINFGRNRVEHNLLSYAAANGLYSLPVQFNALPVMPLPQQYRQQIYAMLKQDKIEGLQISILMTMNHVIAIYKKKGIDLEIYDIFLINNLLQSQSSLRNSEIWYPICLPGVEGESRVFCYIGYLTEEIIHIMISDETEIFPQLSISNKKLKEKMTSSGIIERIETANLKTLITDPSLERMTFTKHFLVRSKSSSDSNLDQLIMSSGNYFGVNENPDFVAFTLLYSHLHHHLVTSKHTRKEKLHVQTYQLKELYSIGYFEEANYIIFFIASPMCELEDCKNIIMSIARFVKEEEGNLWIQKIC